MSQSNVIPIEFSEQWFSRSKTRAPRFNITIVDRPRLLDLLDEALNKRMSTIIAPAGFGKSTLLSQWYHLLVERSVPCAWLNLDEEDRDIRLFLAYLIMALDDAGLSMPKLRSKAEKGFFDTPTKAIISTLFESLGKSEQRLVLILDDYHRIKSKEVSEFIQLLSSEFEDKVHISIGSREELDINLAEMLVSGQAIEITATALCFSAKETSKAIGGGHDEQAINALQERLEGWPVAVQMAKLVDIETTKNLRSLTDSRSHMAQYLTTNILASQTAEIRDFALETSVLSRFNIELADAIRDSQNSVFMIQELKHLNAFIIPLDDEMEWFRYHHLFADCLNDILKNQDYDRFCEIHRIAANWCSDKRLILEAVSYASAIQDYELANKIVNKHCDWLRLTSFGGPGYVQNILDNIPEEKAHENTRVLYMRAYVCMSSGNFKDAKAYVQTADSRIEVEGITPDTLRDQIEIGTGVLSRVEWNERPAEEWLGERLQLVDSLKSIDQSAYLACGAIRIILAVVALSFGDFAEAQKKTRAAEEDLAHLPNPASTVYLETVVGLIEFWSNSPINAKNRFRKTIDLAEEHFDDHSNLKYGTQLLLNVVEYWTGSPESFDPEALNETILSALEGDGWYDIYVMGCDAAIHHGLLENSFDTADKIISGLEGVTDRLAIDRLVEFSQVLRLEYTVAVQEASKARELFSAITSWLTDCLGRPDASHWLHISLASFACARYLKSIGNYNQAIEYVDRGLAAVTEQPNIVLLRVRGTIIKASILNKVGENEQVSELLQAAIQDAAQIDCLRAFSADITKGAVNNAVAELGKQDVDPIIQDFIERLSSRFSVDLISQRESEVLIALANGHSNKQIARDLDLSENTIKFHLRNIYQKLGVKKRVLAVEKARALGLI